MCNRPLSLTNPASAPSKVSCAWFLPFLLFSVLLNSILLDLGITNILVYFVEGVDQFNL